MDRQKKIKYGGLILLLVFLGLGLFLSNTKQKQEEQQAYQFPPPETVVRHYFTAWNDKNYPEMYATLSDGFKKIDPHSKDLATFRQFASAQGIEKVTIIAITEKSNNGQTAEVKYAVESTLSDGTTNPFEGTFTLKNRPGDVIRGWKLIHPYGDNIDTS